jgi:cbb3-type cytochrome oxidase subunit 3
MAGATSKATSGLSTGAQVGIGVGAAVLLLAFLLGAAAFFAYRRRKNKQIAEASRRSAAARDMEQWRSEVGSGHSFGHYEMDVDVQKPKFYEMHSNIHRSELDG